MARATQVPPGLTGLRTLLISSYALDARLTLIRQARSSLDLQTYLLADDATGRLVMRELRDAAARGVRVRLLVDDLYTVGEDELLLGLAAHPNIEVRLFNPFPSGRDSSVLRAINFLADFKRLNHRMHNKLFVADGVAAIVGGRNLADEYFFRSHDGNFIDFEALAVGALVPQLSRHFDTYWNSEQVFPLQAVVGNRFTAAEQRAVFDRLTDLASTPDLPLPTAPDPHGDLPLSAVLRAGVPLSLVTGEATSHADPPDKLLAAPGASADTVSLRTLELMRESRSQVIIFSPYFVPGKHGLERMREARDHGVNLAVVTNAMSASDEPLVNQGYGRYREDMLRMGVMLYEMSSDRLHRNREVGSALGSSTGRLHAKLALVDDRMVLLGSMNLDPRSHYTNTELGVAVRSPEFARRVARDMRVEGRQLGVYEVRLSSAGNGLEWVGHGPDGEETLHEEPQSGFWQRLRLRLLGWLVPEDLL